MKINSNTIYIEKESSEYNELESIIKKIASENNVENVESIQISLSPDKGVIGFKSAQDMPIEGQPEEEKADWNTLLQNYKKNPGLTKEQQSQQPEEGTTPVV